MVWIFNSCYPLPPASPLPPSYPLPPPHPSTQATFLFAPSYYMTIGMYFPPLVHITWFWNGLYMTSKPLPSTPPFYYWKKRDGHDEFDRTCIWARWTYLVNLWGWHGASLDRTPKFLGKRELTWIMREHVNNCLGIKWVCQDACMVKPNIVKENMRLSWLVYGYDNHF